MSSKEAALEEVCRQGIAISLAYLRASIAAHDDMPSRIRTFFKFHNAHILEHQDYVSVYMHERRHLLADARTRIETISRQFRTEIDRLFEEARSRGELTEAISPRSASLTMVGVIRNVHQFYIEGPIRDYDIFFAETIDALLRGLEPAPSAPA